MLYTTASVDLYMSGDAAWIRALSRPIAGIHWTPTPEWKSNFIDFPSFVSTGPQPANDQYPAGRSLTEEEEALMWQSLRASAELLYSL